MTEVTHQQYETLMDELATQGVKVYFDDVKRTLAHLGHPEQRLHGVHITGTKGKGSTAALVAAMLQEAGYRVGLYTSPHLESFTERIRLNGEPISEANLVRYVERVRAALNETVPLPAPPGLFETFTIAAILYFAEQGADAVVFEVGIGGSLDTTNVLNLDVAVVTNVTLDHVAKLGATVREQATDKSGIIKAGYHAITACDGEALEIVRARCESLAVPLCRVGCDVTYDVRSADWRGLTLDVRGRRFALEGVRLPLAGRHQALNAAAALGVAEALAERGWRMTPEAARRGLESACWPGRLEVVSGRFGVPEQPLVVLDGAHHPQSMRVLAEALREAAGGRPVTFVFGAMRDKSLPEMLRALEPLAADFVFTRVPEERAATVEQLREIIPTGIDGSEKLTAAFDRAVALAGPGGVVCVTGSLHLVGDLRRDLRARSGEAHATAFDREA